jgi:hypothetical protein
MTVGCRYVIFVGVDVKQCAGMFHNDSREQQQVLYSITKHAMRRSADEIVATSISFRPKVFSDATSVVD